MEIQPKLLDNASISLRAGSHLSHKLKRDEEQSDLAGRSLVNRFQATPRAPVLQREPARSPCKRMMYGVYLCVYIITAVLHWSAQVRQKWLQTQNTHPRPDRASKSDKICVHTVIKKPYYMACVCRRYNERSDWLIITEL